MASSTSVPSNLSKLTVPQLKALCKERRITGYSKLAKAALLQKLAETAAPGPTQPVTPSANQSTTTVPFTTPAHDVRSPACTVLSAAHKDGNTTHQSTQQAVPLPTDRAESTVNSSTEAPLATEPPAPSQDRTVSSTTSAGKTSGTKRPTHIDIPTPSKRIKTSLKPALTNAGHEPPVPRTSTSQRIPPTDSSVFKVPKLPVQTKRPFQGSGSALAKQPSGTIRRSTLPRQVAGLPGRFKPLVISKPILLEPDQANGELARAPAVSAMPRAANSTLGLNFYATPLPALSHISFPPKASERKWVYRWAIILSALSETDRHACTLVSKPFRYAVYLSAAYILSRSFPGRRLDALLEQHPRNMTNFWPYLRFRTTEVSERRRAFKQSFLGQYTRSKGYDPLSKRLWTNPDDDKQVDIALRFVLTRMWFAISVGSYGHDASTWSTCVVRDVREVVRGEVWQVIAQDDSTIESCSFYVLEATCEVIGRPPVSQGGLTSYLRADWTTWISQRSRAPPEERLCSLLECVKWSNTEDYHQGISKAWLCHVRGQDADSIAKRSVAERYILASIVANSISGQWMSTSAMAQEFAGLPGHKDTGTRGVARVMDTVNMYLPAHHHIESIHFTTSTGEALHTAMAVVQTPGREYYILRDNGMQVGCEEEGIPEVWQQILSCDMLGQSQQIQIP